MTGLVPRLSGNAVDRGVCPPEPAPKKSPLTGLGPVIHVLKSPRTVTTKTWVPGTRPGTGTVPERALVAALVEGFEAVAEILRQRGVADHEIGIARGDAAFRLGDRGLPFCNVVIL